jgi:cyanophycin synthetase
MQKNLSLIKKTVLEMGGSIEEFIPERGCFYINFPGKKRILIENKISLSRQSSVSRQLTRCKDITYKLLQTHNLPTPYTECFYKRTYKREIARQKLSTLSYPIIIKDAQGSHSKGIFPFVKSPDEAFLLIEKELPHYRSMIAQEMIYGKEYRLLFLDTKIIGALEMIPPYVMGNSISTLQELIKEKQKTTEKKTLFDTVFTKIITDQDYTLESIVPKDIIVHIKRSSSLAEGGETRDVTPEVHKEIEKICALASKAVGKSLVGIDVICDDISQSPDQETFSILEINGKPDL